MERRHGRFGEKTDDEKVRWEWEKRRYKAVFKNKLTDAMPALLNSLSRHVLHLCAIK